MMSATSSSHKAAYISAAGQDIQIITVPTPVPTSGQVLVRVLSVLIGPSHKDILRGGVPYLSHFPLTPGGGCIGRVEAVGSDTISIEPGQLVYVDPTIVGRDDPTQKIVHGEIQGFTPLSAKLSINGWRDGTMAEKAIVPLENVIPLNETYLVKERAYSFNKIHMAYRFILTYAGYELAKLKAGDTVVVAFATGSLGNAAVELALSLGAGHVVGLGRDQTKLDKWKSTFTASQAARISAVSLTGDVTKDAEAITAATPKSLGADVYFDLTPPTAAQTASLHIKACIAALKIRGRIILMGYVPAEVSLPYYQLVRKDLQLFGGFMYDLNIPRAVMRMLEMGLLDLDGCETKGFSGLDKLQEALDYAAEHSGTKFNCFLNPQL